MLSLEALRGFAALYVFLHHAQLFPKSGAGAIFSFGQEAVILFFLLSGFVIHYSTNSRLKHQPGIAVYLVHRLRRIYPIMLFGMGAAYLSACLQAGRWLDPNIANFAANLMMLQDVSALKSGVWANTYFGNSPLWSLSYEWWFYIFFIPVGLVNRWDEATQRRIVMALAVGGFTTFQLAPNPVSLFFAYFILWWAGVELSREYLRTGAVSFGGQRWTIGMLAFCTLLWLAPVIAAAAKGTALVLGAEPVLQLRHFAAALAIFAGGLFWYVHRLKFFQVTLGLFKPLGPISYSLYLLHVPVLYGIRAQYQGSPLLTALLAFLLLVPICYLLEVRLQSRINRMTEKLLRPPNAVRLERSV